MITKVCSACSVEKELEKFTVNRAKPDGHGGVCKLCKNAQNKKKYADKAEAVAKGDLVLPVVTTKTCSDCGLEKAGTEFYAKVGAPDGLQVKCKACTSRLRREYYANHQEAEQTRHTLYYIRNRFKILTHERSKRGNWSKCEREAKAEYLRKYKLTHPTDPSKTRDHLETYRLKNLSRMAAKASRYRAARFKATPCWFVEGEDTIIFDEARRISEATGILHEVDHIIPLNSNMVCGLHCIQNLQILTSLENRSKGNRWWPDMW